jgi:hypothetical protein
MMKSGIIKNILLLLCLTGLSSTALAIDIPDAESADAQVYMQTCAACHALPHPGRLDWQDWRDMLYLMDRRMDERGFDKPSQEEWQAMARYLKSNAR